jgi:peptide deformylase
MALRYIRKKMDPVLRKKAAPVSRFTPQLLELLDDMIETMFDAEGIGLAAPQVGISKSIIVVRNEDKVLELINPEIIDGEGEELDIEGCLSFPGVYAEVPRFNRLGVKGMNRAGKSITITARGLMSRVLQHEIDHLNGIVLIDKAVRLLTPDEIRKMNEKQ